MESAAVHGWDGRQGRLCSLLVMSGSAFGLFSKACFVCTYKGGDESGAKGVRAQELARHCETLICLAKTQSEFSKRAKKRQGSGRAQELARRCETLIRLVEKEGEDADAADREERKRSGPPCKAGGSRATDSSGGAGGPGGSAKKRKAGGASSGAPAAKRR